MDLTTTQWLDVAATLAGLAVAGTTLYLAFKTREMAKAALMSAKATADESLEVSREARAAEEQIELSRLSLDAAIRPWITKADAPSELRSVRFGASVGGGLVVFVRVRNVGPGIALFLPTDDFRIEGRDQAGRAVTRQGFAASSVLPPGEVTVLSFVVEGVRPIEAFLSQDRNDGEFWVWIPYSDSNGSQVVHARVHLAYLRVDDVWSFHQIAYFHPVEEEPFAKVEFDSAASELL